MILRHKISGRSILLYIFLAMIETLLEMCIGGLLSRQTDIDSDDKKAKAKAKAIAIANKKDREKDIDKEMDKEMDTTKDPKR